MLGQAKINENLTKKLAHHDKNIKSINFKLKNLTSSVNDQLNFNKILEKQLAQIAAAIPINNNGKIPTQAEKSCENMNLVTTRGG